MLLMNGSEAVHYRIKKEFLVKKKLNISVFKLGALLLLSTCGRSDVTSHSTGLRNILIFIMFGKAIQGLSFGGSIGLGVIIISRSYSKSAIALYFTPKKVPSNKNKQ